MGSTGLWNIARERPDLTAVVGPDGREVTYAELAAAADRYGRGFQAMGLAPGDSVVLLLPNGVDLVSVYFGAFQTGLYVVMANRHLVGAEVAYLVEDSGAKAFVADARFADTAADALSRTGVAGFAIGDVPGSRPCRRWGRRRPGGRTCGRRARRCCTRRGRPGGRRRCGGR